MLFECGESEKWEEEDLWYSRVSTHCAFQFWACQLLLLLFTFYHHFLLFLKKKKKNFLVFTKKKKKIIMYEYEYDIDFPSSSIFFSRHIPKN